MSMEDRLSNLRALQSVGESAKAEKAEKAAKEAQERARQEQESAQKERENAQIEGKIGESKSKLEELVAGLQEAKGMDMVGFPEDVVLEIRAEISGIEKEIEAVSTEIQELQQRLDVLNNKPEKNTEGGVDEDHPEGTEEAEGDGQEVDKKIEDSKKELDRLTKMLEFARVTNGLIRLTDLNADESRQYISEMNQQCAKDGIVSDYQLDEVLAQAESEEEKEKIKAKFQEDHERRYLTSVAVQHEFYRQLYDKIAVLKAGLKELEVKK